MWLRQIVQTALAGRSCERVECVWMWESANRAPLPPIFPLTCPPISHHALQELREIHNKQQRQKQKELEADITQPSHDRKSTELQESRYFYVLLWLFFAGKNFSLTFCNRHSFCLLLSSRLSGADDGVSPAWRDDGLGKAPTPPVPQAWMSRVSEEENHSRGEIQENLSKLFTQHPIPGKLQAHSPWSMTGEGKEDCRTRHELD